MTFIQKSDVHNHTSTKSRQRREQAHPYPNADVATETNKTVEVPREVAAEVPFVPPEHAAQTN